jgi:hypothetical protein
MRKPVYGSWGNDQSDEGVYADEGHGVFLNMHATVFHMLK